MSWAYEAAEEGEIKKNWHKLEKVNKTKTAKVKRIIFAEYFKKLPGKWEWVPNERMIINYQLDIGIASKS